jgi:hypothetical protein
MSASTSPTPPEGAGGPGGGPSPLTVGKRFVKQYYQVLQTNPDQIFRFYQPTSFLSDAEGSEPTDPSTFDSYGISERWGGSSTKKAGFALDIGAIDAQTSVNGSILLVVTGSVVFASIPEQVDRKTFVHTFFLALLGNSKRFYVANDVLRFLNNTEEPSSSSKNSKKADAEVATEPEKKPEEPLGEEAVTPEPVVEENTETDAPGGGVEETKEDAPEEEEEVEAPAAEEVPVEETKAEPPKKPDSSKDGSSSGKGKKPKGRAKSPLQQKQQQQQKQKQQPVSKPVPGSWASLVASGGGPPAPSAPVAPSPSKPKPPAPEKPKEATSEAKPAASATQQKEKEKDSKDSSARGGQGRVGDRPKRDPDCTLVIKNLPDNTKESELVTLFEPFATLGKGKIVGTTVSSHRGLAFVDYDSVGPVTAAVETHAKEPIELNGRVLEVDQKTAEQRARRNMRGGYRSGSPNNGGAYRGGGGGRNQYKRGTGRGGGGDRGGGGRGGRGGRT